MRGALLILRKELREALRDRSLVISLILVPIFFPPILGFGVFQVLQIIQGISERETRTVMLGPGVPEGIREALLERERIELREAPDGPWGADEFREYRTACADSGLAEPDVLLLWASAASADSAVVLHDQSRERSSAARGIVTEIVAAWRDERVRERLGEIGLEESAFEVFSVEEEDTATAQETGRRILSVALPIFLLLMLATATFYASLDTVVGERERTTLETLLTSPLPRGQVLLGKYLFVVVSSLSALLLNLLSVTLFLAITLKLVGAADRVQVGVSAPAFLLIAGAAVLTAGFFAAVTMVVAIPSRTYREGQAVLTPVYMIPMIPGFIVMVSKDPFELKHALVPLLNSAALFKSALKGEFPGVPIFVTFVVLAVVTAVVLSFASKIVSREDVFLDSKITLRQLFTGRETGS